MQTGCAVKSLSQTSVLELIWGVVETQASPGETAEAPRQEGVLPPVHEPLLRRNALGDIFLGIDAERVERFRQDSRGTTAGENAPLASPTEPQDVPRELSRKRRRTPSLYTTLETIYEEEDTEDSASNELLNSRHSRREINNNNAAPGLKRRIGLGDIFEGIDETSVEGLRRMFSHDSEDRRSQDEYKEALPLEGNAKPALKRRKALANIFEGVDTASVKSLRRQYKREAGNSPKQGTAPTSPSLRQTRHALWHVLETLGVSVQGVRSENSHKIDTDKNTTSADLPSTQQTDEARTTAASRKPVLRRQNASPNLLEGLDAAMLEVLRGEGASSADNSAQAATVSDYATFCNSPRATRRRNALTDITDLQKLYQTACKSTGAWLSGMLVC